MSMLPISRIRLDGGTQSRAKINQDVVQEYSELQEVLPELVVYYDGSEYWLAAGFHRLFGAKLKGRNEVQCDIRQGSLDDAVLHSAKSNIAHGMRRTTEDKRACVEMLLNNPHFEGRSDRWIAEICAVSDKTVSAIREGRKPQTKAPQADNSGAEIPHVVTTPNSKRSGKDGKQYPARPPKTSRQNQDADVPSDAGKAPNRNGVPIKSDLPKSVANALADTWHAECARLLSKMRKECKAAFTWSSYLDGAVLDHLKAAEECFLTAVPKKVCPDCKGQKTVNKKACLTCRQGGYIASQVV